MKHLKLIMLVIFMWCGQSMLAMSSAAANKIVQNARKPETPIDQIQIDLAKLQRHPSNAREAAQVQVIINARLAALVPAPTSSAVYVSEQKPAMPVNLPVRQPQPTPARPSPALIKPVNVAGINVLQLKLAQPDKQVGDATCGYRALFIAAAFQKLFQELSPITPETMHKALAHYKYRESIMICARQDLLSSQKFAEVMQTYNVHPDHLFVLGMAYGQVQPIPQSVAEESDFESLAAVPDRLENLNTLLLENKLNAPIFFVCDIGGHWVLLTVMRYQGKITVWYVDSVNADIVPIMSQYLNYIAQYLFLYE